MQVLTKTSTRNIVAEYVEHRTLEDLLEELKMYGEVTISFRDNNWNIEFLPRVKDKEYKVYNYNRNLMRLVKNCLAIVYFSQASN